MESIAKFNDAKIIFLDMDGVLNNAYFKPSGFINRNRYIDKDKFNCLKQIVNCTRAVVVLSTSWREFPDWKDFLVDFFDIVDIKVIDGTPITGKRADEIQEWLNNHPEISNYVILDDYDLTKEFPGHAIWTVAPDRIGLDAEWTQQAIDILNNESKERHENQTLA